MPDRPIVVEAVSVELLGAAGTGRTTTAGTARSDRATSRAPRPRGPDVHQPARGVDVDLYAARRTRRRRRVDGPAIIAEANATTVVDAGWQADVNDHGHLLLRPGRRPDRGGRRSAPRSTRCMLEIFNNLFMSIAEQMGVRLRATATLGEHQGAAGLLLRAVRRRRAT